MYLAANCLPLVTTEWRYVRGSLSLIDGFIIKIRHKNIVSWLNTLQIKLNYASTADWFAAASDGSIESDSYEIITNSFLFDQTSCIMIHVMHEINIILGVILKRKENRIRREEEY